ncbi:MAG: PorV/PorQ family protein [Elusimicrobia bacterium]|nr:PorV/PorQ family protein [Elusimicrobiota bacterium]
MWCGRLLGISTIFAVNLLCVGSSFATELKTGAEFLNISVGARPAGMGNAYTSLVNDVTAIHWNPGGLGLMNSRELAAMYSQWLIDTQYNFLGFGYPTKMGTLAGSLVVLSQGESEARGASREKTGSVKAQDQSLALGFGRNLGRLNVGLNTKWLQSEIAGYKTTSIALDMGLIYPWSRSVFLGLAVQNLGPGMKFINQRDPLPITLATGVSYRTPQGLSLALDAKQQLYNKKIQINIGTEYRVLPMFALRGGYLAKFAQDNNLPGTKFSGLSAGIGFAFLGNEVDYAFTPFGVLGDTHRVSLSLKF